MNGHGRVAALMIVLASASMPGVAQEVGPTESAPATQQTAAWLQSKTTAQLGVYVSHDIFIASFLTGLNIRTFSAQDWVGFLHGAALVHCAETGWSCHPCVPDISELTARPHFVQ